MSWQWATTQTKTYTISNTTPYSYYRVHRTNLSPSRGNEIVCLSMWWCIFYGYQQKADSVAALDSWGIGTTSATPGSDLQVNATSYLNSNVSIGTTSSSTFQLDIYNPSSTVNVCRINQEQPRAH